MHFQMKRYVGLLGVLLMAVGVSAVPASAASTPLNDEVDVNCHKGDVKTIQKGIDNATQGATVKVCKGTYKENVHINIAANSQLNGLHVVASDSVHLECPGSGRASSRGTGFELHASNVTIEGFDVEDCDIAIAVLPNGPTSSNGGEIIKNNTLCSNDIGISITNNLTPGTPVNGNEYGKNSIVHNEICSNVGDGIFDFGAQGDYIFGNNIHDNGGNGIEISTTSNVTCTSALQCGGEYSAVIVDNDVEENGFGTPNLLHGVLLNTASNALVRGNRLSENANDGLDINAGSGSEVAANDAHQNGNDGIEASSTASGNLIVHDRMEKNTTADAADHNGGNTWINNDCDTSSGFATNPCVVD
jgi:parallel beta-helix repeat protein